MYKDTYYHQVLTSAKNIKVAGTAASTTTKSESLPTILWKHNNIKLSVCGTLSYALPRCPLCGCLKNVPIFLDWHIQDFVIVVECYIILCVCERACLQVYPAYCVCSVAQEKYDIQFGDCGAWMLVRQPLYTMHSI